MQHHDANKSLIINIYAEVAAGLVVSSNSVAWGAHTQWWVSSTQCRLRSAPTGG